MRPHRASLILVSAFLIATTSPCVVRADDVPASSGKETGRIVNLYDAFGPTRSDLTYNFGFSAFIEYGCKRILFDAGTDADVLRQNAQALGVDLATIDFAIASHTHADHISGFDYLVEVNPTVRIYFPDDFFGGAAPTKLSVRGTDPSVGEELPEDMRYFGSGVESVEVRSSGRFWNADVV